jgi:4-amino-4-deoxy-L-arabinose transferase-like glycosyltransferase
MFVLLWWRLKQADTTHASLPGQGRMDCHPALAMTTQLAHTKQPLGWWAHVGFGIAMGLGLAYKSFALIAPAAATLWSAQLATTPTRHWRDVAETSFKVLLSTVIALGIFGLWFVLDPDPAAVWKEFVVGENAGKMSNSAGYWHTALLGGGFSIWAQLLGYVQNAGLLAFVVLGLMSLGLQQGIQTWRVRPGNQPWPDHLTILLVWLGVWLLVFTLPSQRSARYLIPAMPALAMLLALYWQRLARGWFVPSLLLCGVFMGVLGRIAWAEHTLGIGTGVDLAMTELAVAVGWMLVLLGLIRPAWTRTCTLVATLAVFAVFGLTTEPLNGPSGLYHASSMAAVQHQHIAVPSSFNGQFERFEFLLPGNRFAPYDGDALAFLPATDNAAELQRLLDSHDAAVWLQTRAESSQPLCAPRCAVLGERWEVKGRHQSGEITLVNLWYPEQWLFRREWLVSRAAP